MEEIKTLKEKIKEIQEKVYVKKDALNPFFKSKYVTLDNILEVVNPLLKEYNIFIFNQNEKGGVRTTITDIKSGEFMQSTFVIDNITDPQKLGACITYGRRYNLVSMLNIVADKDDDAEGFHSNGQGKCKICGKYAELKREVCSNECYKKLKDKSEK